MSAATNSVEKIDVKTPEAKGTGTAPLLYWLAVICGLTGISVLRIDDFSHVVPIWFGAVVGIALGQLMAVLRIRIWSAGIGLLVTSWIIGPGLYVALCEMFGYGADTETAVMALLPAFVCGYASLTERGGLLAFWYPAMLWMLVILDGETPGSFAPSAYMPMVVGLGVFFVAFLRARETRRAALWQAYAHKRLAVPAPTSILSASPVRSMTQLAWTALVGAGAFLVAAWVAPNLWQKDRANHKRLATVPAPVRYDADTNMPCCPESWATEKVREYMPLQNEHPSGEKTRNACTYCPAPVPQEDWGPYGYYRGAGIRTMNPTIHYGYSDDYDANPYQLSYAYNGDGTAAYSWTANPNYVAPQPTTNYGTNYGTYNPTPSTYVPPTYVPPVYPTTVDPEPPKPVVETKPVVVKPKHDKKKPAPPVVAPVVPKPVVAVETPKPKPPEPPKVHVPQVTPPAVVHAPELHPRTGPSDPSAPWGVLLPLLAGVFLVPMGTRFVRRRVTLRHLARPFWKEAVDQRISNHWQRMLIGLRDAGIQMRSTEQPGAFAKRIAIHGMEECATILERVRHGVRVEDEDLATMHKATDEIYGAARKKAGVAGRIASNFRWPLV